ncbi:YesL family protein [Haploplasma axanthum]|uniref:Predicted integral membrane protein n=1 Tax=Haploplasma axanthum TaxID=29552 RepID=A0A449BCX7_HAPAX|nr:YesL family protein [Haploplasma axanthum]VEU80304.1 Predicted integral membrane protein [Haploplasma axanthum]
MKKEYKEKKMHTIINTASDWVLRVILINFLVIATSLLIITILPAFQAGYRLFSDYLEKNEENIFKAYFKYLKEDFWNKVILGTMTLVLIVIAVVSNLHYQNMIRTEPKIIAYLGFFVTLVMGVTIILISLYFPLAFTMSDKKNIDYIFKLSFYLAGKYIVRTILLVIIAITPGLLLLTSTTILLLVFCGIALPILSNVIITSKPRLFLKKLMED